MKVQKGLNEEKYDHLSSQIVMKQLETHIKNRPKGNSMLYVKNLMWVIDTNVNCESSKLSEKNSRSLCPEARWYDLQCNQQMRIFIHCSSSILKIVICKTHC